MDRDDLSPERSANLAENPFAGQGPVLLDIGGDIGAVILHLPDAFEGAEVEYRRADEPAHTHAPGQAHTHAPGHAHTHDHPHTHEHGHEHDHSHAPHVAVVGRPLGDRVAYTAVFPDLTAGDYLLTLPDGAGELPVEVVGGEVTEVRWPLS